MISHPPLKRFVAPQALPKKQAGTQPDPQVERTNFSAWERFPHVNPRHVEEWRSSAVNDDIIRLNVKSLSGTTAYEYLCYSPELKRTNTGRLANFLLRRYQHTEQGGWFCCGLDPFQNWEEMQWGCFKPNQPYRDDQGKLIKYEHPPKTSTRTFFLRTPLSTWRQVAERYKLALPEPVEISEEGEALGFWPWVIQNQLPIVVTEGCKKAASLLSAGYAAIALPGINSGYRSQGGTEPRLRRQLVDDLQPFVNARCPFYICFDHDTKPKTVRAVNGAIATFGGLLSDAGSEVKVITWQQPEKGVDDLIAAQGAKAFDIAYDTALSLEQWQYRQYSSLTYPVSLQLNQRYLGELNIPSRAQIIGIKAPKGTGKTESISQIVAKELEAGRWVLVLTHRVQLGEALCNRFSVPYVTHIGSTPEGKIFGYGLCVDSLHPKSQARFSAEGWKNGTLVIDECEQVLWHLLNSSTCQSDRVAIIKEFKQLVANVFNSDQGRVILSDADLSDLTIDYVKDLAGVSLNPWIVVNDWTEQGWNTHNYTGNDPSGLLVALEEEISLGGHPFVCLTGQKTKAKWGTKNLEARLRAKFPEQQILRIDSETVSDPDHPAFGCIDQLNSILGNYDIVLASPSIETGVSIDLKGHFTSVWGIFQGIVPENSARQALARVREPVDRHIWAASYGIGKISNGSTSVKSLLACQHKVFKANKNLLRDADFEPDSLGTVSDISLPTWAKMACRINAGMLKYRESILNGLRAEGHSVTDVQVSESAKDTLKEEITDLRNAEHEAEAEAICKAEDITQIQFEELQKKRAKTQIERRQERKHGLNLRYGIGVTSDLVLADDNGWHPQLELHYYLTVGHQYLKRRNKKRAISQRDQGNGVVWLPDFNKSQLGVKVGVLELLGFPRLLESALNNPDREYRATDEDLTTLAEKAIKNQWSIKASLGCSIKDTMKPIEIVKILLRKLGLNLERSQRDGTGARLYSYKLTGLDDPKRNQIFQSWLERDLAAEVEAQPQLEALASVVVSDESVTLSRHSSVINKDIPTCEEKEKRSIHTLTTSVKGEAVKAIRQPLSDYREGDIIWTFFIGSDLG
jgi:hypothetical protein